MAAEVNAVAGIGDTDALKVEIFCGCIAVEVGAYVFNTGGLAFEGLHAMEGVGKVGAGVDGLDEEGVLVGGVAAGFGLVDDFIESVVVGCGGGIGAVSLAAADE